MSNENYKKWLREATSYARDPVQYKMLKDGTAICLRRGPLVAFQYFTWVNELTHGSPFFLVYWERLIAGLMKRWKVQRPCYRLAQIYTWVKVNPQAIDWRHRYLNFDVDSFQTHLRQAMDACSRLTCDVDPAKVMVLEAKDQKACDRLGGCWLKHKSKRQCYKSNGFAFDILRVERDLVDQSKAPLPSSLEKWFKLMIDDALMKNVQQEAVRPGYTKSKKEESHVMTMITSPLKKPKARLSPKASDEFIQKRLDKLQDFTNRMIQVIELVGHCDMSTKASEAACKRRAKRYEKVIQEVEDLSKDVIRCHAIHGSNQNEVVACIQETDDAMDVLEMRIQTIEKQLAPLRKEKESPVKDEKGPSEWSLKWMLREILGLISAALGTLLSPWKIVWNKLRDSAYAAKEWARANKLQALLIVLVIAALTYGVITTAWGAVLLSMVAPTFWFMYDVFAWWCSRTWVDKFIYTITAMSLDLLLRKFSEKNKRLLENLTRLKNAVVFILNLLTPMCMVHAAFAEQIKQAVDKARGEKEVPKTDCELNKERLTNAHKEKLKELEDEKLKMARANEEKLKETRDARLADRLKARERLHEEKIRRFNEVNAAKASQETAETKAHQQIVNLANRHRRKEEAIRQEGQEALEDQQAKHQEELDKKAWGQKKAFEGELRGYRQLGDRQAKQLETLEEAKADLLAQQAKAHQEELDKKAWGQKKAFEGELRGYRQLGDRHAKQLETLEEAKAGLLAQQAKAHQEELDKKAWGQKKAFEGELQGYRQLGDRQAKQLETLEGAKADIEAKHDTQLKQLKYDQMVAKAKLDQEHQNNLKQVEYRAQGQLEAERNAGNEAHQKALEKQAKVHQLQLEAQAKTHQDQIKQLEYNQMVERKKLEQDAADKVMAAQDEGKFQLLKADQRLKAEREAGAQAYQHETAKQKKEHQEALTKQAQHHETEMKRLKYDQMVERAKLEQKKADELMSVEDQKMFDVTQAKYEAGEQVKAVQRRLDAERVAGSAAIDRQKEATERALNELQSTQKALAKAQGEAKEQARLNAIQAQKHWEEAKANEQRVKDDANENIFKLRQELDARLNAERQAAQQVYQNQEDAKRLAEHKARLAILQKETAESYKTTAEIQRDAAVDAQSKEAEQRKLAEIQRDAALDEKAKTEWTTKQKQKKEFEKDIEGWKKAAQAQRTQQWSQRQAYEKSQTKLRQAHETKVANLEKRISDLEGNLQSAKSDTTQLASQKIAEMNKEKQIFEKRLEAAKVEYAKQTQELKDRHAKNLESVRASLDAKHRDDAKNALQAGLEYGEKERKAIQHQVDNAKREVDKLNKALRDAGASTESEIQRLNAQHQEALDKLQAAHQTELAFRDDKIQTIQHQMTSKQQELDKVMSESGVSKSEVQRLRGEVSNLKDSLEKAQNTRELNRKAFEEEMIRRQDDAQKFYGQLADNAKTKMIEAQRAEASAIQAKKAAEKARDASEKARVEADAKREAAEAAQANAKQLSDYAVTEAEKAKAAVALAEANEKVARENEAVALAKSLKAEEEKAYALAKASEAQANAQAAKAREASALAKQTEALAGKQTAEQEMTAAKEEARLARLVAETSEKAKKVAELSQAEAETKLLSAKDLQKAYEQAYEEANLLARQAEEAKERALMMSTDSKLDALVAENVAAQALKKAEEAQQRLQNTQRALEVNAQVVATDKGLMLNGKHLINWNPELVEAINNKTTAFKPDATPQVFTSEVIKDVSKGKLKISKSDISTLKTIAAETTGPKTEPQPQRNIPFIAEILAGPSKPPTVEDFNSYLSQTKTQIEQIEKALNVDDYRKNVLDFIEAMPQQVLRFPDPELFGIKLFGSWGGTTLDAKNLWRNIAHVIPRQEDALLGKYSETVASYAEIGKHVGENVILDLLQNPGMKLFIQGLASYYNGSQLASVLSSNLPANPVAQAIIYKAVQTVGNGVSLPV